MIMESKKCFIIMEGPTDRIVLEEVFKKVHPGFELKILPQPGLHEFGKPGAIKAFINLSKTNSNAILCLDFDAKDLDGLQQEVQEKAGSEGVKIDPNRIIGVGMKGDDNLMKNWGINRFAMDDYIFNLLLDPDAYKILKKKEKRLKKTKHQQIINKLKAMQKLFKDNGISIETTKRYLPLIQSVTGWVLGPGTFYQRVIESAPEDKIRSLFGGILDVITKLQHSS